jgi:hypothetical protein
MILIKIELVSAIHESRNKEIGRIRIVNSGITNPKRGDYIAQIMRRGTTDKVLKTVEIEGYPREAYTVWELVRRILQKAFTGELYAPPREEQGLDET